MITLPTNNNKQEYCTLCVNLQFSALNSDWEVEGQNNQLFKSWHSRQHWSRIKQRMCMYVDVVEDNTN
jgi:hypothetical protein